MKIKILIYISLVLSTKLLFCQDITISTSKKGIFIDGQQVTKEELFLQKDDRIGKIKKCKSLQLGLPSDSFNNKLINTLQNQEVLIACWNKTHKKLFIKLNKKDSESNINTGQHNDSSETFIASFNKEGKYENRFAESNNYSPGNLKNCWSLESFGNYIYALDDNFRITEYDIHNKPAYSRLFDVKNEFNTYIFAVSNNNILGAGSRYFPSTTFNTGHLLSFVQDKDFPEAMIVDSRKEIVDQEDNWQKSCFLEIFDEVIKLTGYDWDSLDYVEQSGLIGMLSGGFFSKPQFVWYDENTFFAVSAWGTEIEKYDNKGNIIEKYPIKLFSEYRNNEIKRLKEKLDGNNLSKIFTIPQEIFIDYKTNNLLIFYRFTQQEQERYGFKNKLQLLVFNLEDKREKSPMIDIDFYPVSFDDGNILGIKYEKNQIYLNKYFLEFK